MTMTDLPPVDTTPRGNDLAESPPSPPSPTSTQPIVTCPVPDCRMPITQNALGPHLAMHRRRDDPGTPPAKTKSGKHTASTPGRKPGTSTKRAKLVEPADVADGVLAVLYPDAIPRERLRDVAAWVADTDRLAAEALADRQP